MKKYFYLFLLPLCLGLGACGGDDDGSSDVNSSSSGYSNLSAGARKFVGYWHNAEGRTDFLFKEDGTCKSYYFDNYAEGLEIKQGNWSYDETTQLLTTTIGGFQWSVTLSTSTSWAGLSLKGDGAQSFSQSPLYHFYANLLNGRWVSESGKSLDFRKDFMRTYSENSDEPIYCWSNDDINPAWNLVTSEHEKVIAQYGENYIETTSTGLTLLSADLWNPIARVKLEYDLSYYILSGKRYKQQWGNVTYFNGTLTLSELDSNDAVLKVEGTTYSGDKIEEEYTLR